MQVNRPSGISAVTFFRLFSRAPTTFSALPLRLAPLLRHRDLAHAGQVLAGDAVGAGHDLVGRALGDDVAAVDAGAGADVDHVVGGQDRVLVVLDHDHRVADVAQVLERLQQPRVVALVQADGGLVQHVQHAGQARADLRGQADALALAARQRAGRARQRQIVEADIDQELQPLADLLEDARGDLVLLLGELLRQLGEPVVGGADRHVRHLADVQAVDLHRQRLRLEAIAAAGIARVRVLVARQLLAHPVAVGLAEAALDVADHALERLGVGVACARRPRRRSRPPPRRCRSRMASCTFLGSFSHGVVIDTLKCLASASSVCS